MSKALQNQLSKSLREQGDMARDMAMAELKDLKKDLQELEKTLTAKKAPDQGLLMDISHGSFELFVLFTWYHHWRCCNAAERSGLRLLPVR